MAMQLRLLTQTEYPNLPVRDMKSGQTMADMMTERWPSPDGTLELLLEFAGEIRFGPAFCRAHIRRTIDNTICWEGKDRYFDLQCEECWSFDSRHLALSQWNDLHDYSNQSLLFITPDTGDEHMLNNILCHVTGIVGAPPMILAVMNGTLFAMHIDGQRSFPLSMQGQGESIVIRASSRPNEVLRYNHEDPEFLDIYNLTKRVVSQRMRLPTKIFRDIGFPESFDDRSRVVFVNEVGGVVYLEGADQNLEIMKQRYLMIPGAWEHIIWDSERGRYLLGLTRTAGYPLRSVSPSFKQRVKGLLDAVKLHSPLHIYSLSS